MSNSNGCGRCDDWQQREQEKAEGRTLFIQETDNLNKL